AGTMFLPLTDSAERAAHPEQSAGAILGRLMGEYSQIQEGFALVLQPPPVRGIGNAGGFKLQVLDRTGVSTPAEMQSAVDRLIREASRDPRLRSLFTTFRANVPQLYANIDRSKVKMQDVQVTDVFQTLQTYLGSLYINDFNFLGRVYRVTAQADARF